MNLLKTQNQILSDALWSDPEAHLAEMQPDTPVLYLCPARLRAQADRFHRHFPGHVTYAVKANPHPEVLRTLVSAGIAAFDVASPAEMAAVRRADSKAVLHYNNPIRSKAEVAAGVAYGVYSWSIDDARSLSQLRDVPRSCEVAVRFTLPVVGAAYDFGSKFGASPEVAIDLLQQVAAMGFRPALCFHPGTQCEDPSAWITYMQVAKDIASCAKVQLKRLNLGGGFAARHYGAPPDLERVLHALEDANMRLFGSEGPALLCEPGRAMVSNAFTLATRIKGIRKGGGVVFLNDGIYGGLTDLRDMGLPHQLRVVAQTGGARQGAAQARQIFGPTCDSLDQLPDGLILPEDCEVGDFLLFEGLGAYSLAMSTRFNGYGLSELVTVQSLAQSSGTKRLDHGHARGDLASGILQ